MCFSHNNKLLKDHLEEVSLASTYLYKDGVLFLASMLHDIAKSNDAFQERITGKKLENPSYWERFGKNEHSLPGAIFLLKEKGFSEDNFLSSWLIASHHIGLVKGAYSLGEKLKSTRELRGYLKDVEKIRNKPCVKDVVSSLKASPHKDVTSYLFISFIKSCRRKRILYDLFMDQYFRLGHLILADRLSASFVLNKSNYSILLEKLVKPPLDFSFSPEEVLEKISIHFKSLEFPVGRWRYKIQKQILEDYDPNCYVYMMDVPTGGGKTIAAFLLALKILFKENKSRIFYMLPYVSIIDQTYEVIKTLIRDFLNSSFYLDLDHYLSFRDLPKEILREKYI